MDHDTWHLHEPASARALAQLDRGLDDHNQAAAPLADVRPLSLALHDRDGHLCGAALARTWGLQCELQQLWVDPAWRGRGLGRVIVQAVHDRARARGCRQAYLETWSFQAPGFYACLGYREALRLEGYGPGIVKLVLVCDLG